VGVTPHLLDTCALLWWMSDAPELGPAARRTITNRRTSIVVSTASLWEIAIKRRKGRLSGVDEYLAGYAEWHRRWGFTALAIEPDDAVAAGGALDPARRSLRPHDHRAGGASRSAHRHVR